MVILFQWQIIVITGKLKIFLTFKFAGKIVGNIDFD